jgi:hypothetical protein
MMKLVKPDYVNLKSHADYDERWLQDQLIEDASWLGLGDVYVVGSEKSQPTGGRLDLLLADPNNGRRYTVELQLGRLDESHIVRAIEYWDIERRRYPQYEHVAVIVAEDITNRFLNVIGLLHHSIPLIAIQLRAVRLENALTLVATRVYDYLPPVEPEEEAGSNVGREWWQQQSSAEAMGVFDKLVERTRVHQSNAEVRFNKGYIKLFAPSLPWIAVLRPKKKGWVSTEFKQDEDSDLSAEVQKSPLEMANQSEVPYDLRTRSYHVRVHAENLDQKNTQDLIDKLLLRSCGIEVHKVPVADKDTLVDDGDSESSFAEAEAQDGDSQ